MTFSIEHDFDDLFNKMNKEKIYSPNTFIRILKKSVKPLIRELDIAGPDSLRSFANNSDPNYSRAAEASRAKYGELQKSLGVYKSRVQGGIGNHAVTLGYLPSKQDKAFVAHFLNYGWKNAKSGKFIKTEHFGWMQKAERDTYPQMKEIFDKEVRKIFEEEMRKKLLRAKKRKIK